MAEPAQVFQEKADGPKKKKKKRSKNVLTCVESKQNFIPKKSIGERRGPGPLRAKKVSGRWADTSVGPLPKGTYLGLHDYCSGNGPRSTEQGIKRLSHSIWSLSHEPTGIATFLHLKQSHHLETTPAYSTRNIDKSNTPPQDVCRV